MNKKLVTITISSFVILSSLCTIIYFVEPVKADGPEAQWYTNQTIATVGDFGWGMIEPYFLVLPNGTYWAVINERGTDTIKIKKSFDNGSTWSGASDWVLPNGKFIGWVLDGNRLWVSSVVDQGSPYDWADSYVMYSDDNGTTWSTPIKIHDHNSPGNIVDAPRVIVGFRNGIVASDGKIIFSGFCNNASFPDSLTSIVAWTDASGETVNEWNGSKVDTAFTQETSECNVVELVNGTFWNFMRNQHPPDGKWVSYSEDNCLSWSTPIEQPYDLFHEKQKSPSNAIRFTTTEDSDKNRLLVVFNNVSGSLYPGVQRVNLTVGISHDEGLTFPYTRLIEPSDHNVRSESPNLVILPNNTIGCMYGYENTGVLSDMKFARFNVEWITRGEDWILPTSDTAPQFISINGNINDTVIYDSTPTINWTIVADTSQYWLQVDNNADFSSPEINITDINQYNYPSKCSMNATRVSFTIPATDALTTYSTYYMRVKALTR